jgi:hypothetical protein
MFASRFALRLACTAAAFTGLTATAHGGFMPISLPDAGYQASTTKLDIPTSGPPVTSLVAGDLTISLSDAMSPLRVSSWGSLPFVEDTSPPALGVGVFGASSRVLTFSQPLETFGVEMLYNLAPLFGSVNLTAQFFRDATLVGTITRSLSSSTKARLFAATDLDDPFTSVRLSAASASDGFLIADVLETAVPEPASSGLAVAGLAGLMCYARRHRFARGKA